MIRTGVLVFIGLLWGTASVQAEEVITAKTKPVANMKTEYRISGDYATTTTLIKKTNEYDAIISKPLFATIAKTLKGMAFVTSVVQTPSQNISTEEKSYYDYIEIKDRSNAFVVLGLSTPVTLLFSIEETYRKCVPGKKMPVMDRDEGSLPCKTGETSAKIRGPIAVYGNYATAVNVDQLLKDKAELEITIGKDYSGEDATIKTQFSVKSPSFDAGLSRFFRVLNIPIFVQRNDVSFGAGLLDNVNPLTSRQTLFLGISRIARQAHESMLAASQASGKDSK